VRAIKHAADALPPPPPSWLLLLRAPRGAGDQHTHDSAVFAFHERPALSAAGSFRGKDAMAAAMRGEGCHGVGECLETYRRRIPSVKLAGPTSFAPAVRQTIELVKAAARTPSGAIDKRKMEFALCLIICDGCVDGKGPAEATMRALAEASAFPISVICVGVGDGATADPAGPWAKMRSFDDDLHSEARGHAASRFDNFQFVELAGVQADAAAQGRALDEAFACALLHELPEQVEAATALKIFYPQT